MKKTEPKTKVLSTPNKEEFEFKLEEALKDGYEIILNSFQTTIISKHQTLYSILLKKNVLKEE